MPDRHLDLETNCPHCNGPIRISQNWTAGGINDYGGWVLRCQQCTQLFDYRVGRDIEASFVVSGATVVESYIEEFDENKVRGRHGVN